MPDIAYKKLLWSTLNRTNGVLDKNAKQTFDVSGEYLTVMRVIGTQVLVRLGADSNPFIPVFSRMVLRGPFSQLTFADGSAPAGQNANLANRNVESRVLAYVSNGPLVEIFPPKEYGLRRAPAMFYDVPVTTTPQDLMHILFDLNVVPPVGLKATLGLEGGSLLITNTGSVDLYLDGFATVSASSGAGTNGYGPIPPGASFNVDLDDLVFGYPQQLDGGGLGVKTLSGAGKMAVILSHGDANCAELFQAVRPGLDLG